ncbi:hypothetical protein AWU65_00160 [Paenibacillus glucanolyticus]|uniref:Uncharacterized protein n=2 Tax=Paenibacillus glucanolyticus TaxID=59843 RepID=A0A163D951_9BACL|nr:hypothetical protein AWU65_00160 [Paenibacillus glucanolyticus]
MMPLSNKNAMVISVMLIVICLWFLFAGPLRKESVYNQIEEAIHSLETDLNEVLHIHMDRARTLVFFSTIQSEVGGVTVEEAYGGFRVKEYIGKNEVGLENDLSWFGIESNSENIHMLYGVVNNPETSHILLLSEENKAATIIENNSLTVWYALMKDDLNSPITIRSFNKEGEKLYETGDPEYWSKQ